MILQNYIKKFIRDYFIILGILVFVVTVLSGKTGYALTIKDSYVIMIGALGIDMAGCMPYSPGVVNRKAIYAGICIQFGTLEAVLLLVAHSLGFAAGYIQLITFAFEIAVIYLTARFFIWQASKKDTKQINKKLESMKRCKGSLIGLNHF